MMMLLRQRAYSYFSLLEFCRRIRLPQTVCLCVWVLLLLGFFFGPRRVARNDELVGFSGTTDKYAVGSGHTRLKMPLPQPPPRVPRCHANVTQLCQQRNRKAGGVRRGAQSNSRSRGECPAYFGFIYEDLKPWRESGITLEMVEEFKNKASMRVMIVDGRLYVQEYYKAFQTRDVFTIWGFLQLMEYYPGRLPDLDLMFDCVDWPVIKADLYSHADSPPPPPLFRYCSDGASLDIPFPDWSFWGWAEINIRPWKRLLHEIREGTKKIKWEERDPTAYWKGNPLVAEVRQDLMKCNVSQQQDWNARLYTQDWIKESQEGYKQSKLADQCDHRYKIYVEGSAWSVSLKNILTCDSTTLVIKPQYHDFFSRRLIPMEHYWPLGLQNKCESIKSAVDWGNNHMHQAKTMGKTVSMFMEEEVNMANVYDYMFNLLNEYSKLLRYRPSVPEGAKEVCTRSMYCSRRNRVEKRFMRESMERPSEWAPCTLPDPASFQQSLQDWNKHRAEGLRQVEDIQMTAMSARK